MSDVAPPEQPPPSEPVPPPDYEQAAQARDASEQIARTVFIAALIYLALHDDDEPDDNSQIAKAARRMALSLLRGRKRSSPQAPVLRGEERERWLDDTTRDIIKSALGDARRHKATVADRVRRDNPDASDREVASAYRMDSPWAKAAARTAATRLHSETAMSMVSAIEEATGQKHSLMWISRGDPKVREMHRELHGRVRPVGTPFRTWNGGQELRFPGDPKAPLDATINCRCIPLLIPSRDRMQTEAVFHVPDADFDVPMAAAAWPEDALDKRAEQELFAEYAANIRQ